MKLVVMIPAYNEARTIKRVIEEIPRKIEGISKIEVIVIDDGSGDKTAEIARKDGAIVFRNNENKGLAFSFKRGLDEALRLNADVIVNVDGDGQYDSREVSKLVKPILEGKADIIVGDRRVKSLRHMKFSRKYGNLIASFFTKKLSGNGVVDAQSGFRAFSREVALRLNILSDYTYVAETLIQAANKKLKIRNVGVSFRKRDGRSRLISNVFSYAKRAGVTILKTYTMYRPLKVFLGLGGLVFLVGGLLSLRFFVPYFGVGSSGHIQSLVLGTFLMMVGFLVGMLGIIGDLLSVNRRLSEEILYRVRKGE